MIGLPKPKHFLPALPPKPPIPRGFLEDTEEPAPPKRQIVTGALLKPGCTAADNAIVAHGHLEGLARGLGGFGVLRESKRRLEEAADAVAILKKDELAAQFRGLAEQLPQVHDQAAAGVQARALEPLVDETWDLGRYCKGA